MLAARPTMLAATRGTSAQVRGGGGDVEHWGRGLTFAGSGGATGDSKEVEELVTEFDRGAHEAGAIGGGQTRGGRFCMDDLQFPACAQHHATG